MPSLKGEAVGHDLVSEEESNSREYEGEGVENKHREAKTSRSV